MKLCKFLVTLLLSFVAPAFVLLAAKQPDAAWARRGWAGAAVSDTPEEGAWLPTGSVIAGDGNVVDYFGEAVALDVNTAIIGAPSADIGGKSNQGAAYVFERVGSQWQERQKLIAADGAQDNFFGAVVALEGDTAIIYGGRAAYVFERVSGQWQERQKLDSGKGGWFASAIALQGDTAIIGAPDLNIGDNISQGAAYIFRRSGGEWRQQQKLIAADGTDYAKFGCAIAIDGETAIIGARGTDIDGNDNRGAGYVYKRSGTNWSLAAKLVVRPGDPVDGLGSSVALDGDTAVLGATGYGEAPWSAAYIFTRSGSSSSSGEAKWRQLQRLLPEDRNLYDLFGESTAVYQDTVIVSAPGLVFIHYDAGPGAAYVFRRCGGLWCEQQKLIVAANGEEGDEFGLSLGLYRNTLLVGAPSTDVGFEGSQGRAYFSERRYQPRSFLPLTAFGSAQT